MPDTVVAADEGLALFAGLNATPKKSFLSEYSVSLRQACVRGWQAVRQGKRQQ